MTTATSAASQNIAHAEPSGAELIPTSAGGIAINPAAVLASIGLNPSDPRAQAVVLICDRYNLDPVLKHVIIIPGSGNRPHSIYVTRDGLLHIAHMSGVFDGMEVDLLPADTDKTHWVAVASVYRKDMQRPFRFRGRYPKQGGNNDKWAPEMAEKVAEARALRRAFDISLCSNEERWDEDPQAGNVGVRQSNPATARNDSGAVSGPIIAPPAQQRPQLSEDERAMLAFGKAAADLGFPVMSGAQVSVSKIKALAREVMPRYPDPSEWGANHWFAAERELPDHRRATDDMEAAGAPFADELSEDEQEPTTPPYDPEQAAREAGEIE